MKHARPDYDRFQDPAGLIPADEPVFLLRGQDSLAHIAVRHYAFMAFQANATDIAAAAEKHADAMMAWAKKLPDMPADADFREVDEDPAAVRAARWYLDGRFLYRNKLGAVGYVDGPDSNPGLIAVIKVGGENSEEIAARLHAELSKSAEVADQGDATRQERAEICKVLGCVDKPGVPLRFVQDLLKRNSDQWARINELLRSWDKATPTERQELDRMRRGWGPSTPTERNRRHSDVLGCLQILSQAMMEVIVTPEDEDDVPAEAQVFMERAYNLLDQRHTEMLAIVDALNKEPQEWPDIKAAEERGAMQAQIAPNEMLIADNRRMRAAGLKLAEAAMFVVREFDGTHRLSLAAAEWAKAIGDEGGRGERYAGPPEFEPGRIAFEVRWPAPRETEWSELTDEQRTVWARVEAASRAIGGPEVLS